MKAVVFGQKYKILKEKNLMSHQGIRGYILPQQGIISIDAELIGRDLMHTLIHELVHALIYRTGIDQAKIDPGVEEILCENVSTMMIENFKISLKQI